MQTVRSGTVINNLLVYGLTHLLVDATCIALLFSLSRSAAADDFFVYVLLYDVLAFGLQVLFGIEVDQRKAPKFAALTGCLLTAASVIAVYLSPVLAVVLAGLGNALFHVGGGSISLNLTPKKAAAPGIFVAPGAFGVTIGLLVGNGGLFTPLPFILLLAFSFIAIIATKAPEMDYNQTSAKKGVNYFEAIILLLLVSITVRSLVGMVAVFPWKTDFNLLMLLTLAVVAGKAVGGIIADRFGWLKVGVASLLISAPLVSFGSGTPYAAIIGMFLFQMTMPITLTAISNMFHGRPGFSFGLTCLALIIGALPSFTELKLVLSNQVIVFVTVILSTAALYLALKYYRTYQRQ